MAKDKQTPTPEEHASLEVPVVDISGSPPVLDMPVENTVLPEPGDNVIPLFGAGVKRRRKKLW